MRLSVPMTGDEELALVKEVLDSGYLTQGPKAAEFENLIAELVGSSSAFATSSATTGLHLSLDAVGVQPGDEVIIPDFSFPATANAVIQQGAIPIFVDIDPRTFNIDPEQIESAISPRTRAIMPVHAFGLVADMAPIMEVARRHDLPVVEDAACALGATYKGQQAGSFGAAGVFSFHPRKLITTGEGGMITTSDADLATRIAVLRSHGAIRGDHFMSFVDAGYNYRLSDVHAAIGIAQMRKLEFILRRRRELAEVYRDLLSDIVEVETPFVPVDHTHSYQSYVVTLDESIDRNAMIVSLRELGIESTLGTYSMHLQPYFRERFGIADSELPHATHAHHHALTLPLYPQLEDGELIQVAEALKKAIGSLRVSSPVR